MLSTPSDVLRSWFARVWDAGDESAIDELYAPTAVAHGLPSAPIPGPEGFKPFAREFRKAFPDIRVEVLHAISDGDTAVVHCRIRATHTGPLGELAATNRAVNFSGMTLARVANGQIQEGWNFYDFGSLYAQLGIQPPVAG